MRDTLSSPEHNGRKEHKGFFFETIVLKLLTPENIWAFLLFLIVVALVVFTTDDSPVWIYQGF